MHSENVVDELLAEWELSRRNGRELSAAELCHECPELVSVLEERISALKSTDWLFGISSVVENAESCDATPPRCIGEYEILDRIGAGGMGTVYRARHRRLHKLIALKILPKTAEWNRTAIARFERETRAIGRLENPHIVAAYDAGESDGVHYLAMQLLDGADVGWIAQYEALTVAQACEIVRQAAVGLSAAHVNGLAHRDVKPSNLMLGRDGVVRVLDLGLARLVDLQDSEQKDISSSGQAMGTMDYMAPEQFDDVRGRSLRCVWVKRHRIPESTPFGLEKKQVVWNSPRRNFESAEAKRRSW